MNSPREFWAWFTTHEATIRRAYVEGNAALLDRLLSERVANAASGAGWEIGPYALPLDAFVLSPGTRERIPACRELVNAAPVLEGWRFFPAKPPKDLLSLEVIVGGHTVSSDRWYYRLTSYGGGEFVDLEMFFEECDAPAPADPNLASQLLVEALVGELVSLERIGYIEAACVPSVEAIDHATPLRFLREHLGEILLPLQ